MQSRYQEIRFIAANYSRLQGLREVPVGMLVVFVSVWAIYNHGPTADLTAPLLASFVALLLYWLTDRYYNRVFGQVKQTPSQRRRDFISSFAFSILALLAFALDTTEILPISALGLVFAAALYEDFRWATQSVRSEAIAFFPENFVAAVMILVVSILPVFSISWWEAVGIKSQVMGVFMVIGIVLILAGIWGHLRIIRDLSTAEAKTE